MPDKSKSPFLSMLNDALVDADPELRDKIREIIKTASSSPGYCKKVDDRYNARTYSDKSISYNRLPTYNGEKAAALDYLFGANLTVFQCLARGLIRGYCIKSSISQLKEISGLSHPTIREALKWLKENGYLAVKKPPAGKRTETIWMLNPYCIGNGKMLHTSTEINNFEALADKKALIKFYSRARKWQAVGQTMKEDDEPLQCSEILPYIECATAADTATEKEKKPTDVGASVSSENHQFTQKIISQPETTVKADQDIKGFNYRYDSVPDFNLDELPFG